MGIIREIQFYFEFIKNDKKTYNKRIDGYNQLREYLRENDAVALRKLATQEIEKYKAKTLLSSERYADLLRKLLKILEDQNSFSRLQDELREIEKSIGTKPLPHIEEKQESNDDKKTLLNEIENLIRELDLCEKSETDKFKEILDFLNTQPKNITGVLTQKFRKTLSIENTFDNLALTKIKTQLTRELAGNLREIRDAIKETETPNDNIATSMAIILLATEDKLNAALKNTVLNQNGALGEILKKAINFLSINHPTQLIEIHTQKIAI